MNKTWLQLLVAVITISSGLITYFRLFTKSDQYRKLRSSRMQHGYGKTTSRLYAFFHVYKKELLLIAFTLVCACAFIIIAIVVPSGGSKPSRSPTITPSVSFMTPVSEITTAPVVNLNKQSVFRYDENAIFFDEWNSHNKFSVDRTEEISGIGIMIPQYKQDEYEANPLLNRATHHEVLEFKLCRKYKDLTFQYGVDDDSLAGFGTVSPACTCRLLIQYVNSGEIIGEVENILYEDANIRYNIIKHAVTMDVSDVEILRFTFFWEYDTKTRLSNCLKIVLINPTVYQKSS